MNINVQIIFEADDLDAGLAEIAGWTLTPGAQVVGVIGAAQPDGLPYVASDAGELTAAIAAATGTAAPDAPEPDE